MSAPTMSASGPGLSATTQASLPTPVSQSQQGGIRLPTPMATDGMRDGAGGGAGSTYPLRMILATPRKSDADKGGRGDVLSQLQGHASRHAGMMPTPVKPNGGRRLSRQEIETGRRANGAKAQIDTPNLLRHAAEILPTPTKRDSRMDGWSPAYDRRKSPTMDAVMDGAVRWIAPSVDRDSRTVAVEVALSLAVGDAGFDAVRDGSTARVELLPADGRASVTVPERSLRYHRDRAYIFRLDRGQLERIEVKQGRVRGGRVEVTGDVAAGDRIVTDRVYAIEHGQAAREST